MKRISGSPILAILVTKDRLEKSGIELTEQKSQAEVISEVNRSNIAVARYDEKNDKVTIKESLNG